jgi:hypothetical protein
MKSCKQEDISSNFEWANAFENPPLGSAQNTQLALVRRYDDYSSHDYGSKRRYIKSKKIVDLAIEKYSKNGNGITYNDLINTGLVNHKKQAQETLRYCLQKGVIFTLRDCRPQKYYPTCRKADVLKAKNTQIEVTGVGHYSSDPPLSGCLESVIIHSLEGYVMPLLPGTPLHIHKMQFKLTITSECYPELNLPMANGNKGKEHIEIIGKVRITYLFYANGTVMVSTESSNNPHKIETEIDYSRLLAFFGQIRDRLITFLMDRHERIVPDIMQWELTQCDLNKDVIVSDWLQFTGIKIQVMHLDHLFRIYIKSIGKDTVCRVEESLNSNNNKSAIEVINNVFNPYEKVEKQIVKYDKKLTEIHEIVSQLAAEQQSRSIAN